MQQEKLNGGWGRESVTPQNEQEGTSCGERIARPVMDSRTCKFIGILALSFFLPPPFLEGGAGGAVTSISLKLNALTWKVRIHVYCEIKCGPRAGWCLALQSALCYRLLEFQWTAKRGVSACESLKIKGTGALEATARQLPGCQPELFTPENLSGTAVFLKLHQVLSFNLLLLFIPPKAIFSIDFLFLKRVILGGEGDREVVKGKRRLM